MIPRPPGNSRNKEGSRTGIGAKFYVDSAVCRENHGWTGSAFPETVAFGENRRGTGQPGIPYMTFMSWRSQYAVGVHLIDTEHHKLFDIINEFHEACARGEGRKEIQHLLNRLVAYAEEHFQHEEALMSEHGFPDLDRHRTLHANLVTSVFEINETFSADPARAGAETLQFVHRWLQDHILHEDMEIADFLLRKASVASRSLPQGAAEAGSQQAAPKPASGGAK